MYSRIINPITNKYVDINSKVGKKILYNYLINIKNGGTININNRRLSKGSLTNNFNINMPEKNKEYQYYEAMIVKYLLESNNGNYHIVPISSNLLDNQSNSLKFDNISLLSGDRTRQTKPEAYNCIIISDDKFNDISKKKIYNLDNTHLTKIGTLWHNINNESYKFKIILCMQLSIHFRVKTQLKYFNKFEVKSNEIVKKYNNWEEYEIDDNEIEKIINEDKLYKIDSNNETQKYIFAVLMLNYYIYQSNETCLEVFMSHNNIVKEFYNYYDIYFRSNAATKVNLEDTNILNIDEYRDKKAIEPIMNYDDLPLLISKYNKYKEYIQYIYEFLVVLKKGLIMNDLYDGYGIDCPFDLNYLSNSNIKLLKEYENSLDNYKEYFDYIFNILCYININLYQIDYNDDKIRELLY